MAGHRPYPPASAPPPKQDCLRVKLLPESPDDDANDDAAQCSHADDWRISLGDNRIRDAQQQPKAQAHCPAGPRQASCPYREPNPKAGDESRRDSSLLIGKAHRQHDCDIDGTEHQAADNAQQDSRHFLPVIRLLLIAKRPPVNQLIGTVSTTPRQTVRSKYAEEISGPLKTGLPNSKKCVPGSTLLTSTSTRNPVT